MEKQGAPVKGEHLTPYEENIPETFEVRFVVQKDWKFWEVLAFYLGGVGAGLYAVSQFLNVATGLVVGYILVVGCKNMAHLLSSSRPTRALRAFSNPGSSWISRGAYFILFFAVFGAFDIATRLEWMGRENVIGQSAAVLALLFACMIMIYIGFVMAQSRVMPLWHSPLLPVIFLVYSVALGAALAVIIFSLQGIGFDSVFMKKLLMLTIACTLFFVLIHLLVLMYSSKTAKRSAEFLIKGKTGLVFVGGAVIGGLIIPLALTGYSYITTNPSDVAIVFSGALILIGGFLFESSFLKAGMYSPLVDVD